VNIKVAVLDDHEFICRAISALGRDYPELEVVYTSTYPEEFQAWCLENHPDVAMVDLMLHGQLAGHETIRVLSQAGISCLAFTADHRRVPISMAMRAGARGPGGSRGRRQGLGPALLPGRPAHSYTPPSFWRGVSPAFAIMRPSLSSSRMRIELTAPPL